MPVRTPGRSSRPSTPSRGRRVMPSSLADLEDHLAESDVPAVGNLVAEGAKLGGQRRARIVRDVLVGVGARQEFAVDPLERAPEASTVVLRPDDEDPARLQDAPGLAEMRGGVRDVLDYFRRNECGDAPAAQWQPIAARADQPPMARPEPSQLVLEDVDPHGAVEVEEDATRPAAHVDDAVAAVEIAQDDAVARSLPVPLEPDRAVEGAIVVVGRFDRVTEPPH